MGSPNAPFIYDQLSQIYIWMDAHLNALRFAFLAISNDPSKFEYWLRYASCWKSLSVDKYAAIAYQTARDLGAIDSVAPEMKEQHDYVDKFDELYSDMTEVRQIALNSAIESDDELLAKVKRHMDTLGHMKQ